MKAERHFINKIKAFTLAEVLITLGIIGVVAAMTIPVLMNQINNQELKAGLKKTYSTLSQVHGMLSIDANGSFSDAISSCDGTIEATTSQCYRNLLEQKLKYIKECDSDGTIFDNCISKIANMKLFNGSDADSFALPPGMSGLILEDGTSIIIDKQPTNCATKTAAGNACGWFTIDVNGLKKPNTWGKDIYLLYYDANKVFPCSQAIIGGDDCGGGYASNKGYTCAEKYLLNN